MFGKSGVGCSPGRDADSGAGPGLLESRPACFFMGRLLENPLFFQRFARDLSDRGIFGNLKC